MPREEILPCPNVRFDSGFSSRLERLALSTRALSGRREGAGRAALAGGGGEFASHRAYVQGDDLRRLDWDLYARLDQPFVRVLRRESGERWLVSIDTSASMGVGPPGKLQLAGETAAGLCAMAIAWKGEAHVVASNGREMKIRARRDLPRLLSFLETLSADGRDTSRALAFGDRALAGAARVFVIGDLLGLAPRDVLPLAGRTRGLAVFQILAPCELCPPANGLVRWWDPETGRRFDVRVDEAASARYLSRLARDQDHWLRSCARHRVLFRAVSSAAEFESLVAEVP